MIKRQLGYMKVRYRRLAMSAAQLHTLFALSKLWMVRRLFGGVQAWMCLQSARCAESRPMGRGARQYLAPMTRQPSSQFEVSTEMPVLCADIPYRGDSGATASVSTIREDAHAHGIA